jgi:hypothetical protein
MMREYHVRICERLGVKFAGPTRHDLDAAGEVVEAEVQEHDDHEPEPGGGRVSAEDCNLRGAAVVPPWRAAVGQGNDPRNRGIARISL